MTHLAHWVDSQGRKWVTKLPDGVPDHEASKGVPYGPPSLRELELPEHIELRLHNALYDRGILTKKDAEARIHDVAAAVIWAWKVDAQAVVALYV